MDLRGVSLPPFARTTTFRLSLLYVGLILLTSALLFGLLYQTTVGYLNKQIEERLEDRAG